MKTRRKPFFGLFRQRRPEGHVERGAAVAPETPDGTLPTVLPAPLPEQTLLGQGRYWVLHIQSGAPQAGALYNVYTARGATPLNHCPHCDAPIGGEEAQSCVYCGADLRAITLIYPRFLIQETTDARAFDLSAHVAALRLQHPALIVPEDVFTETTFDPPRHYRVAPLFKPVWKVTSPQPVENVLRWGIALAQGLAHLHQRNVTLQKIDLEHIAINEGLARFVCIDNVTFWPREDHAQAASYFTENVRALAGLLLALLAVSPDGATTEALLSYAQQTAETAGAFAAALEGAVRDLRVSEDVRVRVGVRTDVGRVRGLNEDSVLALDLTGRFAALDTPVGVYAVADGMGGHAAGDVASQLTIRTIQEAVESLSPGAAGTLPDARAWLEQLATLVNQAVYTQRQAVGNDMGCTLVLALMVGARATIANIGDSRAYWLAEDGATQITTDHSLVERLVAGGHISAQEARQHPRRNVIYRVVGDKPAVDFDVFEQALAPGEALLLCSDGLSGMLGDAQIWALWRAAPSPQAACDQLVEAANHAGGTDNISVIVIQAGAV